MGRLEAELRSIRLEIEKVLRRMEGRLMRPVALKMEDAAWAIGVGDTKLAQLVRRGDIATFRVDRRRLVRVVELEEWALRQSVPVPLRFPKTRKKTEGDKVRAALKKQR